MKKGISKTRFWEKELFGEGYAGLSGCLALCRMWGWSPAPPRSLGAVLRSRCAKIVSPGFFQPWALRDGSSPAAPRLGGAGGDTAGGERGLRGAGFGGKRQEGWAGRSLVSLGCSCVS